MYTISDCFSLLLQALLKQHCLDDVELSVTGRPVLEWPSRKVCESVVVLYLRNISSIFLC